MQYGEGADKFAQITRQKQQLWNDVTADGRLKQLTDLAPDSHLFAVNEAYQNEMWYYAGVESNAEAPENARAISFPDSQYLVVTGAAENPGQLFAMLEGEVKAQGRELSDLDLTEMDQIWEKIKKK